MPCSPFAPILARLRGLGGGLWRADHRLAALTTRIARLETTMAETESQLLVEIRKLRAQATEYTTTIGKRIADAAEKAAAAQKLQDQQEAKAEHDAAMAELAEISKELVDFSPSGN